ncbi:hypothetical protein BASA81_012711 [Batrachochytrium salamandrivorans]|nr:hypothetical protein BASA81_012711 [Batrachochytrium salamandrivorans]
MPIAYSPNQLGVMVLALFLILGLLTFPPFQPNNISDDDDNDDTGPGHPVTEHNKTSPPPVTMNVFTPESFKRTVDSMSAELAALSLEVKRLRIAHDQVLARLQRVESAEFLDGSLAMHAVFANLLSEGNTRVKLCEWPKCQFQPLEEGLQSLLAFKTVAPSDLAVHVVYNCSTVKTIAALSNNVLMVGECDWNSTATTTARGIKSTASALELVKDRTVSWLYLAGNGKEDSIPVLRRDLNAWMRKVKHGGLVVGQGYGVQVPFATEREADGNQLAIKSALDAYRTGEDNDLGQDQSVWVGGSSLWYFVKIKASIFG